MHSLLDLVAPANAGPGSPLHELSFGAARGLPRSEWRPPQHALMASDLDLESRGDQADLEQAWAPTVRMGL
jgi:hypothetical protein